MGSNTLVVDVYLDHEELPSTIADTCQSPERDVPHESEMKHDGVQVEIMQNNFYEYRPEDNSQGTRQDVSPILLAPFLHWCIELQNKCLYLNPIHDSLVTSLKTTRTTFWNRPSILFPINKRQIGNTKRNINV